ncbi:MAG: 5'-nucleotidase C-terminal domain-containing protein, partial [Oscillospiraceae bacterium]|nr:5'-nucleotidase C-terminal domain-containing protein [Oscillospiraceae bacterium]
MKRTKRLLALFLSLMLLAALAVPASADYDYAANAKIFHTDYTGKTVILHTNDVHGAIEGYAYIPALRARLEAAGAEVFVVDGGDYSQGSAYVSASKGASAVALMNEAGYDVVALGNHEFDYGYAVLKKNMEAADFKVVCADVYQEETGETIFDPTALIETKGGLKLGFFGMETPETASKVNPPMIKGISFASFDDLYASAQIAVNSLKEQGADLIIGLTHLGVDDESAENGYRSLDLYDKVPDIDFLIDAHSHTVMTGGENGEPIQSTGTGLKYIGVVVIDNETKTVADNFLMETAGLEKDEKTAAAVKAVIDAVDAEYGEVFAESQVVLNGVRDPNRSEETNMGEFITESMVWSVSSTGGLDQYEGIPVLGINNGGGIRASIEKGPVTKRDVQNVLPFGNTIAVVLVNGKELLEVLEASTAFTPESMGAFPQTCGMEWTVDTTVPYDQGELYILNGKEGSYYAPASIKRVSIKSVGGEPFDPDSLYVVVTNNFCAAGGDTYNAFNRAYSQGFGFDTGIP